MHRKRKISVERTEEKTKKNKVDNSDITQLNSLSVEEDDTELTKSKKKKKKRKRNNSENADVSISDSKKLNVTSDSDSGIDDAESQTKKVKKVNKYTEKMSIVYSELYGCYINKRCQTCAHLLVKNFLNFIFLFDKVYPLLK